MLVHIKIHQLCRGKISTCCAGMSTMTESNNKVQLCTHTTKISSIQWHTSPCNLFNWRLIYGEKKNLLVNPFSKHNGGYEASCTQKRAERDRGRKQKECHTAARSQSGGGEFDCSVCVWYVFSLDCLPLGCEKSTRFALCHSGLLKLRFFWFFFQCFLIHSFCLYYDLFIFRIPFFFFSFCIFVSVSLLTRSWILIKSFLFFSSVLVSSPTFHFCPIPLMVSFPLSSFSSLQNETQLQDTSHAKSLYQTPLATLLSLSQNLTSFVPM